ncbi:MAG: hypothetical protein HWD58_10440 [Bacteroidota bacterium]|nr:MAG: hypothetical protein HWD58_10440 [Bacteroidota bacterium]
MNSNFTFTSAGLACYQTATFNNTTCQWDVTGTQPAMPTLACYETASFNTTTCVWDVTGSMPAMPTLACYETASFNTTTCAWDVTGSMPAMPTLACYETASFNTTTCVWDVTGSMPAMPTLACYETASFNTTTCVWDVTGSMPAMPTLACYETASFNTTTCMWDVTGSPNPPIVTTASGCGNYFWSVNNMTYASSGTYSASMGCQDYILNLTIDPLPTVTASDVSACAGNAVALIGNPSGGSFSVANPYTGPTTTYTYSYTDANGCTNTSAPANIFVTTAPP